MKFKLPLRLFPSRLVVMHRTSWSANKWNILFGVFSKILHAEKFHFQLSLWFFISACSKRVAK
jgi:hypothetical protein